jgi:hypothetical protein
MCSTLSGVDPRCPRCLELEDEVARLRQRLGSLGHYVAPTPGPNRNADVERELARWLAVNPGADAAAGFRAGWARLARFIGGVLREWEARWFRQTRENERLRAHIGQLIGELSRLRERG